MPLHVHFVPHVPDFPVFADPVGHAHDAEKRLAQEAFHSPRAVSFDHFEFPVRQQRKVQVVLLPEFPEKLLTVAAAAEDCRVQLLEFPFCVAKLGRFIRSTRRHCLGEKVEHDILSAILGERDFFAVIGCRAELRRALPGPQWFCHFRFLSCLLEQSS